MIRTASFTALLLALSLSGCSGCKDTPPPVEPDAMPPPTFDKCGADGPAFVREATLAILGRRPTSQHEVDAYAALYDQVAAAQADGTSTVAPRTAVARALLSRPERGPRWTVHFMDALRVTRVEDQSQRDCWGATNFTNPDGALATYVRDNPATAPGTSGFTMLDLAHSAIALDDPTIIYRAHLFPLVSLPITAANVPPVQAELARREDFGNTFDQAYLNRDIVCLACHNSEQSVTDNADPARDRHWPLDGFVDQALFGMSAGEESAVAHAMFRVDGFVDRFGQKRPWGMDKDCGTFANPASLEADPANIDGRFGSLTGKKLTVFDLDLAMKRGFDHLRGGAVTIGSEGQIADPDDALAYAIATNLVESVWREVIGSRLTIANYFPRNQAAKDELQRLTNHFLASGYSLDQLLVDIVTSDYFARLPPEAGCGADPYTYPAVYDPWTIADTDPAKHGNGPGDAVAPVSPRTLLSSAYAGLEWGEPDGEQFPLDETGCEGLSCNDLQQYCGFGFCCDTYATTCQGQPPSGDPDELPFQQSIGVFLKNGERGFRGLDFQARLGWEDRFGACAKPARLTTPDVIDRALTAAAAVPTATVGDVLALLKDRLVGEAAITADGEQAAIEALVGQPLTAPASSLTAAAARRFCGVLLSSPQFVLSGLPARGGTPPTLALPGDGFDDACAHIRDAHVPGFTVTCAPGALTATANP
ncbi:MAG: hypothetical protein K8W52_35545 [Deltaproteobacteria bacterium]|nr:hypothetical protein [Deltaproteobacteria bacterium]